MYIPEFWAGVISCLFLEGVLLIGAAMFANLIHTAKEQSKTNDEEND